ncbi:MAG: amino acid adenylation domain-containing protein [Gammaproteobacteria bacterium]|nr:amino acid adenylation domain-containing protein [Gammaproteobacteria bacterium]
MAQDSHTSYWTELTQETPTQVKTWLEGFGVHQTNDKSQYLLESFTLPQKSSISLNLLYCAWGLLLNRFSGSDDIIFGLGAFNGPYFPVRSKTETEETLGGFLKKQTQQIKESQTHLASLDASHEKYYRHLFITHQNLNIEENEIILNPELFPLLLITTHKNPKNIIFCYNQKKFTPSSIKSFAEHLFLILEKLKTCPDHSVTHFSILTVEDKQKFDTWSQSHLPHTSEINKSLFVHDLFMHQAQKFPTHLAVSAQNKKMTYGELNQLSNQVACFLHEKKIRAGDTVAVLMERSPALIAVMLGIFKIGAIFVPINPKYPDDRIQFILNDSQTHLIFVNQTHRIPQDALYKTVILNESCTEVSHYPTHLHNNMKENNADQLAYIVYTSGTTGQPKGVTIRHSSLMNLVEWYQVCFKIDSHDRASQFSSLGFDAFFCEIIPFLAIGASVHIVDDSQKLTPPLFFRWLVEEKITICDLTTAYAQILFNLHWPEHLSLRVLKIGGESLTHYPTQTFPFDIWNIYGPTEGTIEATFAKIVIANVSADKQPCQHLPPPIGKPLPNTYCYIVDSHLELVPPGCAGELLIGGANLSPGYLNRAQLTREKFIRNVFSENVDDKLYRTGDLVRWLPDGNLEFLGRIDHQVKIRGYRIELSEIESALSQFPDVGEVIVLAKENTSGQKSLVAWLVPNIESLRIPWQERCLVSMDGTQYTQAFTEDISKAGIAINSVSDPLQVGQIIQINLKLPGASDGQWLTGKVVWQQDRRAGIHFEQTAKQKTLLQKSVEYYLSTHNLMETLQSAATKRNLRQALKKKLPEYMIPSSFSVLPRMPLTFNGKIDWKALPPPQDFQRLLERTHVAPRTPTEQSVADIWCRVLGQSTVSITDNFFDLGGNSLLVSKLLIEIMDKFHLTIPAKIFLDLPFIPVIAEYIDSKGESYTKTSSVQDEISRDIILNEDILPTKKLSPTVKDPQNILLTGSGGFLGLFLLRELIRQTNAKIYCLVRPGEYDSIATRLNNQIEHFHLTEDLSLSNRRIVLVAGDIGLHQFGIPGELYDMLINKIDCIYHCGAQVNTMAAYTTLRTSNVQGTIEIIRFATQGHDKPIYYVSTLSAAFEKDADGNYAEVFPGPQADELSGGYAISKWVSERLLTQLMQRGLPVHIYRSGYIGGPSDTGITNQNDSLLLLIKGCIQMGYAPDWQENIALLPVDFVSKAIVTISQQQPERNGVFHIDHPVGMLWTDLVQWLVDYGYNIKLCSHKEWLRHLEINGQNNVLFPFLPYYLSMKDAPHTPNTGMKITKPLLDAAGFIYPELGDTLLATYINYLEEIEFLPAKEKKSEFV